VGPIAGSLQVQRNVFAVNQLKIQKGKGAIGGQLVLDYLPGAERIKFRGNATGLRLGSRKERLDGNLALVFLPATLELNGRVQILRLSRQHLLELLDLLDPFREDPSFNRLRRVLAFGHPSFVRLEMSQGLMSMKVNLGGMAALIRMDAIRGIALGPFMNRHVAPLLPSL
jgi:translocation and assembly module TamB